MPERWAVRAVVLPAGSPEAFFHPIDNKNERYEELTEDPDWSFYGSQFLSKESILDARDRVIARLPTPRLSPCTWRTGRKTPGTCQDWWINVPMS